ncbi:MAG: hypothetical protein U1F30_00875 [Steroidobacteraceae bacterium]
MPIVIGGMGVDISSAELALEAARLGGIGHISAPWCRRSRPAFPHAFRQGKGAALQVQRRQLRQVGGAFRPRAAAQATRNHVSRTMEARRGDGLVFINCMEKLTMNGPRETLRVRAHTRSMPASTASRCRPACTSAPSP